MNCCLVCNKVLSLSGFLSKEAYFCNTDIDDHIYFEVLGEKTIISLYSGDTKVTGVSSIENNSTIFYISGRDSSSSLFEIKKITQVFSKEELYKRTSCYIRNKVFI